jgi:signal transduction histidine kinase/HD-like signal output (HDOD) protein
MGASGFQRRKIEVLLDEVDSLPTLPGVAYRLLSTLSAPRLTRRDLQLIIEADAVLSARAVRLALDLGSPPDSVTSIDAVLAAVPLETVAADLLGIDVVDPQIAADLDLARLWRHALATGMAAQAIATRLETTSPPQALLAGMLHDIGQAALAITLPRAYRQVLDHAALAGTDLVEAERKILHVDHATIGKRLAGRWGFSETLQNVIWLHHQAEVPATDAPADAVLLQVVRLADLVVRQEGFGYLASEQLRDGTAEGAERLGLSGAAAEQIGRQIASAFVLNAEPAGLQAAPTPEQMQAVLSGARVQLGRLYRSQYQQALKARADAGQSNLLVHLSGRLAACRSAKDVLAGVVAHVHEALGVKTAAVYLVSREGGYVEGILGAADATTEHFIHSLAKIESAESLLSGFLPAPVPSMPGWAEGAEAWLCELHGAKLGAGPFYTVPLTTGKTSIGGLVLAAKSAQGSLPLQDAAQLTALASVAAVAIKRVQAEADLVALSEEFAEVNRDLHAAEHERVQRRNVAALGEMAAGAAHEINNPLAIISGRAQQLAADEKVPARQEILKTIVQQASRVSDILADLRQFAHPPAPQFAEVDAAAVAREIVAEFQRGPNAKGPQLRLEAPDAPARIRVDRGQVSSALREIVKNALEACSNGAAGNVTVAVQPISAEGGSVRLAVIDDGPGMDPQVRARAFDPFFCGREAGRRRGLGLSKAYRAVIASGGQMTLESAPGHGTTVRLTFHAAQAAKN